MKYLPRDPWPQVKRRRIWSGAWNPNLRTWRSRGYEIPRQIITIDEAPVPIQLTSGICRSPNQQRILEWWREYETTLWIVDENKTSYGRIRNYWQTLSGRVLSRRSKIYHVGAFTITCALNIKICSNKGSAVLI